MEKIIMEKEQELSKLVEKNKAQKKIILEISEKNKEQESQIVELRNLNMSLQKEVVTAVAEMAEKFKAIDLNNLGNQNNLMEIGQIVGDEVHIGQGILLGKTQFDACYVLAKTASKFAKDIALAVFGVETLKQSSITGRKGNRLEKSSKPPLDPTKLQAVVDIFIYYKKKKGKEVLDLKRETEYVKACITSKISDLNRQPRAAAGNKTNFYKKNISMTQTEIETETGGKGVKPINNEREELREFELEKEENGDEQEIGEEQDEIENEVVEVVVEGVEADEIEED